MASEDYKANASAGQSNLRAVPSGCINRETERLQQLGSMIGEQIANLEGLAERAFGSTSQSDDRSGEVPCRSGAIGRLTDSVDDLYRRAERLAQVAAGLSDVA